jgi:hypothetical protein
LTKPLERAFQLQGFGGEGAGGRAEKLKLGKEKAEIAMRRAWVGLMVKSVSLTVCAQQLAGIQVADYQSLTRTCEWNGTQKRIRLSASLTMHSEFEPMLRDKTTNGSRLQLITCESAQRETTGLERVLLMKVNCGD